MTNTESSRAAEADCANMLAKPIPALCNLAISQGVFPNACKVAKLKPIFKKGKKTDLLTSFNCFHLFGRSLKV